MHLSRNQMKKIKFFLAIISTTILFFTLCKKRGVKYIAIGSCLCLFGCKGYQYIATPNYVPVNTEKGQFTCNFSFNNFQAGYAFANNFSIYAEGFYRENNGGIFKGTITTKENGGAKLQTDRHSALNAGLTFFKNIDKNLSLEIVAGIGSGILGYSNTVDMMDDYNFTFDARKISYSIQPVLSLRIEKYFDISFFSRLNMSRYYNIRKELTLGNNSAPEKIDHYLYETIYPKTSFFEPGMQLRIGFERVKFQAIISRSVDFYRTGMQYRQFNFHLGLSVDMNLLTMKYK